MTMTKPELEARVEELEKTLEEYQTANDELAQKNDELDAELAKASEMLADAGGSGSPDAHLVRLKRDMIVGERECKAGDVVGEIVCRNGAKPNFVLSAAQHDSTQIVSPEDLAAEKAEKAEKADG